MSSELPPCQVCDRNDADLGALCSPCCGRIRIDLADCCMQLPDVPWPSQGQGGGTDTPLPGGTDWISWNQGGAQITLFRAWVIEWSRVYGFPLRDDLTTPNKLAAWLNVHLPHVRADLDDFAMMVHDLAQTGRRLAGMVAEATFVQCPAPKDGDPANDALCLHRLPVNPEDRESEVRCRECKTRWTVARLMAVALHTQDAWADGKAAAFITGMSLATLKRWANPVPAHHPHADESPCNDYCRDGKAPRIERRQGKYSIASILAHKEIRRTA